ncbi:hypothetical protein GM50_16295 [freshwater metagenome]|jgi:uncharacterized protein (DUF1800 family)|uniref:DUF1800 domain-containing protein n=1 Tax=freshwater metagenome TaxID=449393 RepID=A0A094PXC7_9ZZZZ
MDIQRLETARLFHRFGYGPKPGEFRSALNQGLTETRQRVLTTDTQTLAAPELTDLGPRPAPNSPDIVEYSRVLRYQNQLLLMWWLDQMVTSANPLNEKMTWFWHGHWATSVAKVNYALPMYNQNVTLRKFALGNFTDFAQAMFFDGALQVWLDGGENTVKAPNENLSREMMELFTLGINRFTEQDVKELARAFTGYRVTRTSGVISTAARRRDNGSVTVLGKSAVMPPEEVIAHLVSQESCQRFIPERIWYRFISSTNPLPDDHPTIAAFASRDIKSLVTSLVNDPALSDPDNSVVRSPVEWFVGVCRALNLTPSQLPSFTKLYGYLEKLSQVPFQPPNVGGWPTDQAWLSSASAQFRLAFATWLASLANLSELAAVAPNNRVEYLLDWLGIMEWSARTDSALRAVRDNPQRLFTLAICSPEYVVSA